MEGDYLCPVILFGGIYLSSFPGCPCIQGREGESQSLNTQALTPTLWQHKKDKDHNPGVYRAAGKNNNKR